VCVTHTLGFCICICRRYRLPIIISFYLHASDPCNGTCPYLHDLQNIIPTNAAALAAPVLPVCLGCIGVQAQVIHPA
jgi:hypothetical protein